MQWRRQLDGNTFIYLCSAQLTSFKIDLISKEINGVEQEYMNMSPSLIELATPLLECQKQLLMSSISNLGGRESLEVAVILESNW